MYLVLGDLERAASHMETFHHLSHHGKWHTESGDNLHDIACEHLRRIYTSIAEQVQHVTVKHAEWHIRREEVGHIIIRSGSHGQCTVYIRSKVIQ